MRSQSRTGSNLHRPSPNYRIPRRERLSPQWPTERATKWVYILSTIIENYPTDKLIWLKQAPVDGHVEGTPATTPHLVSPNFPIGRSKARQRRAFGRLLAIDHSYNVTCMANQRCLCSSNLECTGGGRRSRSSHHPPSKSPSPIGPRITNIDSAPWIQDAPEGNVAATTADSGLVVSTLPLSNGRKGGLLATMYHYNLRCMNNSDRLGSSNSDWTRAECRSDHCRYKPCKFLLDRTSKSPPEARFWPMSLLHVCINRWPQHNL